MREPNLIASAKPGWARRLLRRMLELLAGVVLAAITIAALHGLRIL